MRLLFILIGVGTVATFIALGVHAFIAEHRKAKPKRRLSK